MDVVGALRADLFREPQRRRSSWFLVGFGVVVIGFGLAGDRVASALGPFYYVSWEFILLGFGFLLVGTADVLPADRGFSAGVLRIAGILAWVLYAVVIVSSFI